MQIADLILEESKKRADKIAIHDVHGSLTYGDFANEIIELSNWFSDQGIKPKMGVAVMGKNSRSFIITVFALLKLDAVVMPVSNQLKQQEVDQILEKSGLHFIADDGNGPKTSAEFSSTFEVQSSAWTLSKYKAFDAPFASHVPDAAIVRYTSGTTGKAKGVIIGHNSINERIDAANACLQLGEDDTVIWVLQMSYHFVVSIILYLKYGSSIALCESFLADKIVENIENYNGTFLYASPMHIKMLNNYKTEQKLETLTRVISTSTAISKMQCDRFYEKFAIPISQAYGIIEIGLPIINHNKGAEHPDAVGLALDQYTVDILSDDMSVLPIGSTGHLAIKGPGMFDAYLDPPLSKDEICENGYFMTGDLASKNEEGIIKVEGRKKTMINVSGNKVFPFEIEQIINEHPSISMSRVSGFQHRIMGEIVKAEVILKPDHALDSEALISYCRERLTTYKIPQKISFVSELPMTDSGKIKRN